MRDSRRNNPLSSASLSIRRTGEDSALDTPSTFPSFSPTASVLHLARREEPNALEWNPVCSLQRAIILLQLEHARQRGGWNIKLSRVYREDRTKIAAIAITSGITILPTKERSVGFPETSAHLYRRSQIRSRPLQRAFYREVLLALSNVCQIRQVSRIINDAESPLRINRTR